MSELGITQRVNVLSSPFWWRIERVHDHYCGVVSGMVVCVISKESDGDGWHAYEIDAGGNVQTLGGGDLRHSMEAAARYCVQRAS